MTTESMATFYEILIKKAISFLQDKTLTERKRNIILLTLEKAKNLIPYTDEPLTQKQNDDIAKNVSDLSKKLDLLILHQYNKRTNPLL